MCELEKSDFGKSNFKDRPETEKLEAVGCAVVDSETPEKED